MSSSLVVKPLPFWKCMEFRLLCTSVADILCFVRLWHLLDAGNACQFGNYFSQFYWRSSLLLLPN